MLHDAKKSWAFSDLVAVISVTLHETFVRTKLTLTVFLSFCYIECDLFAVFTKILFHNWRRFCCLSVVYVPVKCPWGGGIWWPVWTLVKSPGVARGEGGSWSFDLTDTLYILILVLYILNAFNIGERLLFVYRTWYSNHSVCHTGRDPFNQNFRKFQSNRKSFKKTGPPFVDHFSRSDRSEFGWIDHAHDFMVWTPSWTGLAHFASLSCVQFCSPGSWYLVCDTRLQMKHCWFSVYYRLVHSFPSQFTIKFFYVGKFPF